MNRSIFCIMSVIGFFTSAHCVSLLAHDIDGHPTLVFQHQQEHRKDIVSKKRREWPQVSVMRESVSSNMDAFSDPLDHVAASDRAEIFRLANTMWVFTDSAPREWDYKFPSPAFTDGDVSAERRDKRIVHYILTEKNLYAAHLERSIGYLGNSESDFAEEGIEIILDNIYALNERAVNFEVPGDTDVIKRKRAKKLRLITAENNGRIAGSMERRAHYKKINNKQRAKRIFDNATKQ